MARLVVDVDIRALDVRQGFNFDLQRFGAVVRFFDGLVLVDDDVDFDDEARAGVPGADGVEGEDHRVVGHCLVGANVSLEIGEVRFENEMRLTDICQVLQHGRVRGNADEELELVIRSS